MPRTGSTFAIDDAIGGIETLDTFLQLVAGIPVLLEQRPHRVDNKEKAINAVVYIQKIGSGCSTAPRGLGGQLR